jgi:hypothetical protein
MKTGSTIQRFMGRGRGGGRYADTQHDDCMDLLLISKHKEFTLKMKIWIDYRDSLFG